jgi:hypothetical protein
MKTAVSTKSTGGDRPITFTRVAHRQAGVRVRADVDGLVHACLGQEAFREAHHSAANKTILSMNTQPSAAKKKEQPHEGAQKGMGMGEKTRRYSV